MWSVRKGNAMDKVKMGRFLSSLRLEKNFKVEDEADLFLLPAETIRKWESGENIPDVDSLGKICSLYDVDYEEIINGERKTKMAAVVTENKPVEAEPTAKKSFSWVASVIYGAALLLLIIVAFAPTARGTETLCIYDSNCVTGYVDFSMYQLMFQATGGLVVWLWFSFIFFLAGFGLSFGLLSKNRKRVFWWLSFSFVLAALVSYLILVGFWIFGNKTGEMLVGFYLPLVVYIAAFVLFLTLPQTRLSSTKAR